MKRAGYVVDEVPSNTGQFIEDITAHATNDRQYMPEKIWEQADGKLEGEVYCQWLRTKGKKYKRKCRKTGERPRAMFSMSKESC